MMQQICVYQLFELPVISSYLMYYDVLWNVENVNNWDLTIIQCLRLFTGKPFRPVDLVNDLGLHKASRELFQKRLLRGQFAPS